MGELMLKKFAPWTPFLITFTLLYVTSAPSIGWWNSSGYAACAYTLGIPDPGGSILFVLIGKIFSLLLFFLPTINAITLVSIASTSLASVFLYYSLLVVFENLLLNTTETVKIIVSFFTALSLPFLYSIWIESTVAQVYVLGLLITSILIFYSLKIWFSEDENEKRKLFYLIAFLIGLDFTAHRLNTPFIPVIILLLIFPLRQQLKRIKFWLILTALYLLGFSVNLYLLFRSPMYPAFAMDSIQNLSQLLGWINMKRIGESNFSILFDRRAPFWDYQINHMYLRYFGWNFLGTQGGETVFSRIYLSFIPLLLGLTGFIYSLIKRLKLWVLIFATFFFFSFGLVVYSNIQEGFDLIREIDRLFIPSFYVFLIFVGIGLYVAINYLHKLLSGVNFAGRISMTAIFVLSFLILPLNIISTNWYKCDKSGYYFPIDFAYNLLVGCEENGILFTNGDNDTYPLWYLQTVEGFRRDVSVVNLSLLNTSYYINQLQRKHNLFPKDSEIFNPDKFRPSVIDSSITIKIMPDSNSIIKDSLSIKYFGRNFGNKRGLVPQDKALIVLVKKNGWNKPVYFSITVNANNTLGLSDYFSLAGIVEKLSPIKNDSILPNVLEDNLLNKYRFRNFSNPDIYADRTTVMLFNTYRSLFIHLSQYYLISGDKKKARHIFEIMESKLPEWRFSKDQNSYVESYKLKLNE